MDYSEPKEKSTGEVLQDVVDSVSREEWESLGYPFVTYIPRDIFTKYNEISLRDHYHPEALNFFWEEIFNTKNFVLPNSDQHGYNPKEHFLFVVHRLKDRDGKDTSKFKAVTTSEKFLRENGKNILNLKFHGDPCESNSQSSYPTCDFWNFYDLLDESKQQRYPFPSREYIKSLYFGQ